MNKFDINHEITKGIENWCENHQIKVAGKISHNPVVTKIMIEGIPGVDFADNEVTDEINKDIRSFPKSGIMIPTGF